jgi:hypothetical protein
MIDVPAWVTEGWGQDWMGLKLAILHYQQPASTPAERRANAAYAPSAPTFGCSSCGRFAFAHPTICFWCARNPA